MYSTVLMTSSGADDAQRLTTRVAAVGHERCYVLQLRMLRRALCGAAPAKNRFVRFGYRRPPPWPKTVADFFSRDSKHSEEKAASQSQSPALSQSAPFQQNTSSWSEISNAKLRIIEVPSPQDPNLVPLLAHGTEIVLRGDGVYPLEAPWTLRGRRIGRVHESQHSRGRRRPPVYYDDSLRKIVQPENIAWNELPSYIPAAKDSTLHDIGASLPGVKYTSSTSSITPAIATLYHLLSNFRDTDLLGGLSAHISELPNDFAKMHRRPTAFTISRNKTDAELYSVNAHSGFDTGPSILRDLGHSMERMLTMTPQDFNERYVIPEKAKHMAQDIQTSARVPSSEKEQFYHYSKVSSFLLRAQIDCRNGSTGEVFDVKTRAVAPIRYDLPNYAAFTSHRLRFLRGKSNSYEREFYDMVRTVFLKYALQLRIGRMSGALVAYHNTTEVLGLEFIPLKEIHSYIFGGDRWADIAFGTAMSLLEKILEEVTAAFPTDEPGDFVKVLFVTDWSRLRMFAFAQLVRKDEDDPFGVHSFVKTEENSLNGPVHAMGVDRLAGQGQWHYDSFLHTSGHRGISVVGAHRTIRALGGEVVNATEPENQPRKKGTANDQAFNHTKYDFSAMTPDRFGVWELHVDPLINGTRTQKKSISLRDEDSFTLKYCLKRVESPSNVHFASFVTGLGRVYTRK